MSFVSREEIYDLIEEVIVHSWPRPSMFAAMQNTGSGLPPSAHVPPPGRPFLRMTYADAMRLYGSDKPDTTFPYLVHSECIFLYILHVNKFSSKLIFYVVGVHLHNISICTFFVHCINFARILARI